MKKYEIVKSAEFCGIECDFYSNENNDLFMTAFQLGSCLGYSAARESINKIVERNKYLKDIEFTAEVNLTSPSGTQKTRLFTEDGIYEVTMLAKTEKAKEFRAFVRKIVKSIRKGENSIVNNLSFDNLLNQMKTLMTLADELEDISTIRHNAECANMLVKVLEKKVKRLEEKTACAKPFTPPTLSEIEDFCEVCDVRIDAEKFYYYYESIGWTVKGKRITNWKARARYWERNDDND